MAANLLRVHSAPFEARKTFISSMASSERRSKGPDLLTKAGRETGGSDGSLHDVAVALLDAARRSGDAGAVVNDSGVGRDGGGL